MNKKEFATVYSFLARAENTFVYMREDAIKEEDKSNLRLSKSGIKIVKELRIMADNEFLATESQKGNL